MSKKSYITLITLASIMLAGFVIISIVLASNNFSALPIDTSIANFFYSIRGEYGGFTYWFFRIFTEFGYTYIIVAILLVFAICNRFKLNSWIFAGATLFTWGLQRILKLFFDRPRPDETLWWMTESSSSFPSGHSMMVAFVFAILIYFILTSPHLKSWLKKLLVVLSTFIIIIVPISRLVLGVHYFTDVLGGLFIGGSLAILFIILHSYFTNKKSKNSNVST